MIFVIIMMTLSAQVFVCALKIVTSFFLLFLCIPLTLEQKIGNDNNRQYWWLHLWMIIIRTRCCLCFEDSHVIRILMRMKKKILSWESGDFADWRFTRLCSVERWCLPIINVFSRPYGTGGTVESINMNQSLAVLPNSILRHFSSCIALSHWS